MRIAMICSPIIEWHEGRLVPAYMDGYRNNPHLGPYLLAAVIREAGFDVTLVDLTCVEEFRKDIVDGLSGYDVVLLSCNSTNWPTCRLLATWLKERFEGQTIVLGGIHASLFGTDVIRRSPVDYVIRGEGEKAIVPLLRAIETGRGFDSVPGLIWRQQDGQTVTNRRPPLLTTEELDRLPLPLYDAMPPQRFKTLAIESSRGCKGSCAFCAIPFRKHWRPISPGAFVDRIVAMQPYVGKVELSHFSVVDDCLTIDKDRVIAITDELDRRGVRFEGNYDARVKDFLDEEVVERLAPYTRGVLLGAESFSSSTLKRIGKSISPEDIVRCARTVERYGLAEDTIFSFIIGFPWESKRDVRENISRIVDLAFTYGVRIFLQWHTLTPGSALWAQARSKAHVTTEDLDEVGFLLGEKWFHASSTLSVEDRLDISDMIISVQKVLSFTRPFGSTRSQISFIIPPYLLRNKNLTETWRKRYEKAMSREDRSDAVAGCSHPSG